MASEEKAVEAGDVVLRVQGEVQAAEGESKATDVFSFCDATQVIVFFHADCPDGIAAALLLSIAVKAQRLAAGKPRCDTALIPLQHAARAHAYAQGLKVQPGATVAFLDISPHPEDVAFLASAADVLIMDHHESVASRVSGVVAALPDRHVMDLSLPFGIECATSLVARHFARWLTDVRRLDLKVQLLHNLDVWEHELPAERGDDARAFEAFVATARARDLLFVAVHAFVTGEPTACLTQGLNVLADCEAAADALFRKVVVAGARADGAAVYTLAVPAGLVFSRKRLAKSMAGLPPGFVVSARWADGVCARVVSVFHTDSGATLPDGSPLRAKSCGAQCALMSEGDDDVSEGGGHAFAGAVVVSEAARAGDPCARVAAWLCKQV